MLYQEGAGVLGWSSIPRSVGYQAWSDFSSVTVFITFTCVKPIPFHPPKLTDTGRPVLVKCLLRHWNGRSFFPLPYPSHHVYSDASGSFGCGAFLPGSQVWFQLCWPDAWMATSIAAKELLPIVVAASLWGSSWEGKHVCFHCDNEAVVTIIRKRCAKDKLLTDLLRCLFFYASVFHFQFSAIHIAGASNRVADAISRNQLSSISFLFPQASRVLVPPSVSQFLLAPPDWGSPNWMEQFNTSLTSVCPPTLSVATAPESGVTSTFVTGSIY